VKTVFIGGSRRISRLNEKIREKLDKIITRQGKPPVQLELFPG